MKMIFTKQKVTAMRTELAAIHEYMHKHFLIRETAASHRLEKIHHL